MKMATWVSHTSRNDNNDEHLYDDGEESERARGRRPSALMQKFTGELSEQNETDNAPMTISFDVITRGRFKSTHRLLQIDLKDMKIVQHLSKDQTKLNDCTEVDISSFEIAQGKKEGLLSFNLVSKRGNDDTYTRQKQFQFTTRQDAYSFTEILNLAVKCGAQLKHVFKIIDLNKSQSICADNIVTASKSLSCGEDDIFPIDSANAEHMIHMGDHAMRGELDFASWFNIFTLAQPDFTGCELNNLSPSEKGSSIRSKIVTLKDQNNKDLVKRLLTHWFELSQQKQRQTAEQNPDSASQRIANKGIPLVAGEEVLRTIDRTRWRGASMGDKEIFGTIRLTNYRLYFTISPAMQNILPPAFDAISIPLGTVNRVETVYSGRREEICIFCKDLRLIRIAIEMGHDQIIEFRQMIADLAFPKKDGNIDLSSLFAFSYQPKNIPNRWDLFDPEKEYSRIGLIGPESNFTWRLLPQDFTASDKDIMSPTYPRAFIVPNLESMSEAQIRSAAKYRSRQRMPAACWMHKDTGAVLARSSQPMLGITQRRNEDDIFLLNSIRLAGRNDHQDNDLDVGISKARLDNVTVKVDGRDIIPRPLYIADCRGKVAATGNKLQGKGAENVANYRAAELLFCDILNIHTMRESQSSLATLLMPEPYDESAPPSMSGDPKYLSKLDAAGWLRHVSLVMSASVWCARKMTYAGASVLCHCSDGWDRTAQVCATSQMLLDPYYRTLEGFGVLVEKEWLSFGHKFQDRVAHGSDDHDSQERSPIMIQWLEVVWQIVEQIPSAFEYDERMLIFVADHLFSCLFGNFLGNTDLSRHRLDVRNKTTSIWSYILAKADQFRNPNYVETSEALWPICKLPNLKLWGRYYLRHNPENHPHKCSGTVWIDDYGEAVAQLPDGQEGETAAVEESDVSSSMVNYGTVKL
uniref:Myotubularin phosphatase domain-containing protein n=1 Tax=Octactis speculum TaxID=3111310 RepID=A0A7S2H4Y3_9STRA|mmetsp:Transcript_61422/g.84383  ORF Transcript_61422/g.84383 Transcript_61422/m.84383 type:complete len:920 (+) Transcript_61422:71-2830(+)|eukprot:CAMPEP_0185779702 /NCGR_PEP_ID=MMETSP1174-20130828/96662_1 /TAXON_ID=35687 /ORGANISM="Dictyocha speculum, Strain CCMP1381" /LENGTH=919 /DNA_ID=CAMNT_0028468933 /DNA_START=71 /DNA_END=2830 /DNA_ORIENTATION=+